MPDFLDDESPQDQLRRLIAGYSQPAPPQTPVSSPPASPVAVPNDSIAPVVTKPVSVPPVASGTEDLEKQESSNVAAAHPVAAPPDVSPLAQQEAHDEARLTHIQSSGAGEDRLRTGRDANGTQIMGADGALKKAHPILGTIAKIGDIGLSSLFPTIAAQIPGTAMYHNRAVDNAQSDVATDIANQGTAATTAHVNAETANLENPAGKEEEWAPLPGVQGPNGQPILHEKHSNQLKFGDIAGVQPIKTPNEKPDTPEQQYQEAIAAGDHNKAAQLLQVMGDIAKAKRTGEKPPAEPGSWTIAEGKDGKPVLFNNKTGQTKAAPDVEKAGTHEKKFGGAEDAMNYATGYLDGKAYTGPGDEALLEKFFELAKPSSGFRMTQSQIELLQNAQSWKDSLSAKYHHATTGTWFSDEQRQQIVQTMKDLGAAKLHGTGTAVSAAGNRPSLDTFEGK